MENFARKSLAVELMRLRLADCLRCFQQIFINRRFSKLQYIAVWYFEVPVSENQKLFNDVFSTPPPAREIVLQEEAIRVLICCTKNELSVCDWKCDTFCGSRRRTLCVVVKINNNNMYQSYCCVSTLFKRRTTTMKISRWQHLACYCRRNPILLLFPRQPEISDWEYMLPAVTRRAAN